MAKAFKKASVTKKAVNKVKETPKKIVEHTLTTAINTVEKAASKQEERTQKATAKKIVIQAEGVGNSIDITNRIIEETGIDTRLTILGHIQRGGTPSARDRVMASRFGEYAVHTLVKGKTNRVVCSIDNDICDIDINEALDMKKDIHDDMYTTSKIMSL